MDFGLTDTIIDCRIRGEGETSRAVQEHLHVGVDSVFLGIGAAAYCLDHGEAVQ
jgi:hypothetical protein